VGNLTASSSRYQTKTLCHRVNCRPCITNGSVDLYFGPELPEGVSEKNWIKTKPGEGWFTLPRLYAPLEPILNKTWRWNDIERVK
jgi:hypothetical protein